MINSGYLKLLVVPDKTVEILEDIKTYKKDNPGVYYSPDYIFTVSQLYEGNIATGYLSQFYHGNTGNKDYVEIIKECDGKFYIFKDDNERKRTQTPLEAINFIKENYEKIDETKYFEIYESR